MPKRYFLARWKEFIRDFTSLGDPVILFILLLLFVGIKKELGFIILLWVFIEVASLLIRYFFFKDRPIKLPKKGFLEKSYAGTFPSMHTARSTFIYLVLFVLVNSPMRFLFLAILLFVGITRVLLKTHYITDILGGYIFGALIFTLWWFVR